MLLIGVSSRCWGQACHGGCLLGGRVTRSILVKLGLGYLIFATAYRFVCCQIKKTASRFWRNSSAEIFISAWTSRGSVWVRATSFRRMGRRNGRDKDGRRWGGQGCRRIVNLRNQLVDQFFGASQWKPFCEELVDLRFGDLIPHILPKLTPA